jgi:cell division protein FtsN
VPEKRFQFYDILPGKADAVPDKAPKPDAKKEAEEEERRKNRRKESRRRCSCRPVRSPWHRTLTPKAKLAFMGLEAVVQQVMIQEKTFYRVRVGPSRRSMD